MAETQDSQFMDRVAELQKTEVRITTQERQVLATDHAINSWSALSRDLYGQLTKQGFSHLSIAHSQYYLQHIAAMEARQDRLFAACTTANDQMSVSETRAVFQADRHAFVVLSNYYKRLLEQLSKPDFELLVGTFSDNADGQQLLVPVGIHERIREPLLSEFPDVMRQVALDRCQLANAKKGEQFEVVLRATRDGNVFITSESIRIQEQ